MSWTPDLGRIEVFRLKEGGFDRGLLFDARHRSSSPSFPEIGCPRWRLFSRLCSREKRKNLENASSGRAGDPWCATWSARAPGSCMRPCPRTIQSDGADTPRVSDPCMVLYLVSIREGGCHGIGVLAAKLVQRTGARSWCVCPQRIRFTGDERPSFDARVRPFILSPVKRKAWPRGYWERLRRCTMRPISSP